MYTFTYLYTYIMHAKTAARAETERNAPLTRALERGRDQRARDRSAGQERAGKSLDVWSGFEVELKNFELETRVSNASATRTLHHKIRTDSLDVTSAQVICIRKGFRYWKHF